MKSLIFAIQALTRINIKQIPWDEGAFGRATAFFPLVGLFLGCSYLLAALFLINYTSSYLIASLLLIAHIILTGALHLDGLLDTIDAVFSHRSPERMLEIMKDSRVGSNAVVGAISIFLLRFTITAEIVQKEQLLLLVLAPLLARFNQVFVIYFFPYIRPQGLGSLFKIYTGKRELAIAALTTLASILLISFMGLNLSVWIVLFITTLFACYWGSRFTRLFHGLTGDLYGALSELTELLVLLAGYIITLEIWG